MKFEIMGGPRDGEFVELPEHSPGLMVLINDSLKTWMGTEVDLLETVMSEQEMWPIVWFRKPPDEPRKVIKYPHYWKGV